MRGRMITRTDLVGGRNRDRDRDRVRVRVRVIGL